MGCKEQENYYIWVGPAVETLRSLVQVDPAIDINIALVELQAI